MEDLVPGAAAVLPTVKPLGADLPDPTGNDGRELRESLRALWASLLDVPAASIGDDSSFLELGGNSLLLLCLQAELAWTLGIDLSYQELPPELTFAALCERVASACSGRTQTGR